MSYPVSRVLYQYPNNDEGIKTRYHRVLSRYRLKPVAVELIWKVVYIEYNEAQFFAIIPLLQNFSDNITVLDSWIIVKPDIPFICSSRPLSRLEGDILHFAD
jgi:hypothetical protein